MAGLQLVVLDLQGLGAAHLLGQAAVVRLDVLVAGGDGLFGGRPGHPERFQRLLLGAMGGVEFSHPGFGQGPFLVEPAQAALELVPVAGSRLLDVAVAGFLAHQAHQFGVGPGEGGPGVRLLPAQVLGFPALGLDGPIQGRCPLALAGKGLLHLAHLLDHGPVAGDKVIAHLGGGGDFRIQTYDLFAQVGRFGLQAVDLPLEAEAALFLIVDRLALFLLLELDVGHRRVDLAQRRAVVLVGVALALDRSFEFTDPGRQLVVLPQGQVQIQDADAVPVGLVLGRLLGLTLQRGHLAADFREDVLEPGQVLSGGGDLAQRFLLAGLEAGDAGGLFEVDAPLVRAGVGDGADVALLDDGIGPGAHAAAHEDVENVLEPAGLAVDQISPFAGAVLAPGDADLAAVLEFHRPRAVVVGQGEGHFGHVQRGLAPGAGEDDIFHRLAAQLLGALFPHDPAQGVDDVALAATVGSHHGGDAAGKRNGGPVAEGFETDNVQMLQPHGPLRVAEGLEEAIVALRLAESRAHVKH